MAHIPEVIPTVVPSSLEEVVAARARYAAFAPALHIDVADGVFAQNTTWTPAPGEKLPEASATQYEAHLMVETPLSVGVAYARAGAKRIIGHVEAFSNADCARDAFTMWRGAGATEVGLALLLDTPLEVFSPYVSLCDCVLVMTIATIGVQGVPFDVRGIAKVSALHTRYPRLRIAVDGGGNPEHVRETSRAGATRFIVGSDMSRSTDPAHEYARLVAAYTPSSKG